MRIRIKLFTSMRIRILLLMKVMQICRPLAHRPPFWATTDLHDSILSLKSQNLLYFDFNPNPDPAFRSNADPSPCGSGSDTLLMWSFIMAQQHQDWTSDRYNWKPYLWLPPESEPELKLLFREPSGRRTGAGSLFYKQKMRFKKSESLRELTGRKSLSQYREKMRLDAPTKYTVNFGNKYDGSKRKRKKYFP